MLLRVECDYHCVSMVTSKWSASRRFTQDTTHYGSLGVMATSLATRIESKAIANREDLFGQLTEVKDELVGR